MTADEIRKIENFAISQPLSQIDDADMLAFLASLIQDHDHLREKLMTEPDRDKRDGKFEAMRPYLKFRPHALTIYELAEAARQCGVQPIYQEQEEMERKRIWMPPSFVHEVPS